MEDKVSSLRLAQLQGADVLRRWHSSGAEDLSIFEEFSLASLSRMEIGIPLSRLFHAAALGRDPESRDFLKDGQDEKYGPIPELSLNWRRTDARARAFRLAHRLIHAVSRPAPARTVLFLGASSNRRLWDYWFDHRGSLPFRFDFALRYPPGLSNGLRAAGLGSRLFDPEPRPLTPDQLARLARMRAKLAGLSARPDWRGLFSFEGRDFSGLFEKMILAPFAAKLEQLAVKCLAFQSELLAKAPDLILLPEISSPDLRLLLALARKHRIPAWHLEHGFPGSGYTLEENLCWGDHEADLTLCWSEGDRRNYLKAGVPAERLEVTGPPAFDAFFPAGPALPLRSVEGATVLVLSYVRFFGTTEFVNDNEERFFTDTGQLLDRLGARKIIYKLHSGIAHLDFYRRLEAGLKLRCPIELHQGGNFQDMLGAADAVIGPVTTGVFETMLRGKDYFLVHYDPSDIPPPFERINEFVAKNSSELEKNLREGRPVPRDRALAEFCGIDGTEQPWHFTKKLFAKLSAAPKDR
ncbi:MAG: hypothetical protein HY077_13485 [Elusimicrobia bacterium]|nr:hypothetical protein [Elusimicrobiota bacterium]